MNIDGYEKGQPGMAGAGGLDTYWAVDHWILVYYCIVGVCHSGAAELQGLFHGLSLAWERGFCNVQLDRDSSLQLSWSNVASLVLILCSI